MTHSEAKELLLDLAYGELPAARALEVQQHVETCVECVREQAQLASTRRTAALLTEEEQPPPGFDDRILAAARAEASLRADGTPGAVIEVTGSVRPAGLEPAVVDPLAPVRTAPRAARPRRALRWATFGSVAAAAALVLAVTSTRGKRPEPAVEAGAYEIHIKAPQQQPAPAAPALAKEPATAPAPAEAQRQPAANENLPRESEESGLKAAGREQGGGGDVADRLATAPAATPTAGKGFSAPAANSGSGAPAVDAAPELMPAPPVTIEAERAKKAAPGQSRAEEKQQLNSLPEPALAGSGAASRKDARQETGVTRSPSALAGTAEGSLAALSAAARPAAPAPAPSSPEAGPAPAKESAGPASSGLSTEPGRVVAQAMAARSSTSSGPSPAPRAAAPGTAAAPLPSPAAAATSSPDALEDAARKSRREANYALAAAQYRKAARVRQGAADPSTAAWDLAHAIECLSAISQWDEARAVDRELRRLYPSEQSAAAAAARALRPAQLAPSSDDSTDIGK